MLQFIALDLQALRLNLSDWALGKLWNRLLMRMLLPLKLMTYLRLGIFAYIFLIDYFAALKRP